jgi:hypothetical protein
MSEKKRKKSDSSFDDSIRDVGPIYTDSKGNKSQIPSKEMFKNQPAPTYGDMYGDRGRVEAPLANVDIMGNVTGPEDITKTFSMGGLTEQPHLGYIPRSKGGSILAKGNKLAKHKPTKLY